MYFPRNWEFGSALSKLWNNFFFFGGGFEPPKPPSGYASDSDKMLPSYSSTAQLRLLGRKAAEPSIRLTECHHDTPLPTSSQRVINTDSCR
jgi:hypothetical protein